MFVNWEWCITWREASLRQTEKEEKRWGDTWVSIFNNVFIVHTERRSCVRGKWNTMLERCWPVFSEMSLSLSLTVPPSLFSEMKWDASKVNGRQEERECNHRNRKCVKKRETDNRKVAFVSELIASGQKHSHLKVRNKLKSPCVD